MTEQQSRTMTPAEMREVQMAILNRVDSFCSDRGLSVFLWAGTLLGAVRHGGFIPWDDDIDLAMPRQDYEKFCREFSEWPFSGTLELYSLVTSTSYALPYAKVTDTRTRVTEETLFPVEWGVGVDIFPIDEWPRVSSLAHRLRLSYYHSLVRIWATEPTDDVDRWKWVVLKIFRPWVRRRSMRSLAVRISACASRPWSSRATSVGVTAYRYLEKVEKPVYGTATLIGFEGGRYPAPAQASQILERLYGDYMTPPVPADQVNHGTKAFWCGRDDGAANDVLPYRGEHLA